MVCHLTDQYGNRLSPYFPHAVTYTEQRSSPDRLEGCAGDKKKPARNWVKVCLKGYLAIFEGNTRVSPPIPFEMAQKISLFAPKRASITFRLKRFRCRILPTYDENHPTLTRVTALLEIESVAVSYRNATLQTAYLSLSCGKVQKAWYEPATSLDACCFLSCTELTYDAFLRANVCQYTALSDGVKRQYTNQDALHAYGGCGILPPSSTSYCNLYVNGMLQPKVNYRITEGLLTFLTTDVPPKDAPIVLQFISFCAPHNQRLLVQTTHFITRFSGGKRLYRNQDALPLYSDGDIPSPEQVSYYSLYSNGVLQPRTNYEIREGILELKSSDTPNEGSLLFLECVTITNQALQLLPGEVTQYNALANPWNCYSNEEELAMYGPCGIPAPYTESFQQLMVNGVLQPQQNYSVQRGCLCLHTENTPPKDAPIILQSVRVLLPPMESLAFPC